jgi:hypothetical protein
VSKKYLPVYLAELQFRYNHRKEADIFGKAIAGAETRHWRMSQLSENVASGPVQLEFGFSIALRHLAPDSYAEVVWWCHVGNFGRRIEFPLTQPF